MRFFSQLLAVGASLAGFYYRRDEKLGTYRVWHKALTVKPARLSNLGIVQEAEQAFPYSILIEPINEFTIYLPPKVIG